MFWILQWLSVEALPQTSYTNTTMSSDTGRLLSQHRIACGDDVDIREDEVSAGFTPSISFLVQISTSYKIDAKERNTASSFNVQLSI